MSPDRFDHSASLILEKVFKANYIREPISVKERLAITLRFLASGDAQQSLSFQFKVGKSTVHKIVDEVCEAIWETLSPEYMRPSSSNEDWKRIAKDFLDIWNMPNCIGAIDGKHIAIRAPRTRAPYGITTRDFSVWCFLLYATDTTVLAWLI